MNPHHHKIILILFIIISFLLFLHFKDKIFYVINDFKFSLMYVNHNENNTNDKITKKTYLVKLYNTSIIKT